MTNRPVLLASHKKCLELGFDEGEDCGEHIISLSESNKRDLDLGLPLK